MDSIVVRQFDAPSAETKIFIGYEKNLNRGHRSHKFFCPANGGCRIKSYKSDSEARQECVELSETMSMKHRVFSTGFSGGKIVIRCNDAHKINRESLMNEVAQALIELDGDFFTGLDVNTTFDDMRTIMRKTEKFNPEHGYILAGMGSSCDPNFATAIGTVAAVQEVSEFVEKRDELHTVLVLGVGKVGSQVAAIMSQMPGFNVLASDIQPQLVANIPDVVDVSDNDWTKCEYDILVPCTGSHIIDQRIARRLNCRAICGSSNIPIDSPEAMQILQERKIIFVPESISSAGAILQDSIEFYAPDQFSKCHPAEIYGFIATQIKEKTIQYLRFLHKDLDIGSTETVQSVSSANNECEPAGQLFSDWKSEFTRSYDVAIVGAGMAGTACAYSLAKETFSGSVVILDQGSVASALGASYGQSRMYREMYSDPFYSKLMTESLAEWNELQDMSGTKLLSRNGLLFFGSSGTGETAEGSILGAIETVKSLGIEHKEFKSSKELSKNFDGLQPGDGDVGVYSVSDGSIASSQACKTMCQYAKEKGVSILENTTVLKIFRGESSTHVNFLLLLSDWTVIKVQKKLVLTAGAWTSRLLKENFKIDLNADVQMVAWGHFELPDNAPDMPQWFCFRNRSHTELPMPEDQHGLYYGFPSVPSNGRGRTTRMVKIGTDFTPDVAHRGIYVPKANKREVHEQLRIDIQLFLKKHWPNLGNELDLQSSPYHMTPSQDFVLGSVPGVPNLICFCGDSGRAFKFAPVLGGCMADIICGKETRVDISRFDPRKVISNYKTVNENGECTKRDSNKSALGKSHVPYGQKGDGLYSLATQGCFDVINRFRSSIMEQAEAALFENSATNKNKLPIVLCDFGAADGGTSLNLWTEIIRKCREIAPDREVEMKYEDQPNSDFQSLFYYTQGRIRVQGRTTTTYLEEQDPNKIFVSAIGTSFHERCLPSESLDLGFSSTAMHWLSSSPEIPLPDGVIHHTLLQNKCDATVSWAQKADEDWERILLARASELKSGGRMVILNFCIDEDGQSLGNTKTVQRVMFQEMAKHWREMMEDGKILEPEFARCQIMNYYRTVQEMTSVFFDETSKVYKAGLRLVSSDTAVTPCPYRSKWLENGGDVYLYAKNLTLTMRTWSNSSYESALNQTRPKSEIKDICDEFYNRLASSIVQNPDEYGMDYVHACIALQKVTFS